jgi:hypothetical protein
MSQPWNFLVIKNWLFDVWAISRNKISFLFNYYFWMSKLNISQAFWQHQACPIPTLHKPMVNFCSKWVVSSFFLYFLRTPTCSYVVKTTQGLKGKVLKKKFVLLIESWVFTFFQFCFLFMVLHDVIFNMIATI